MSINLATFKEFKENRSETSNYRVPTSAVEPQPNDKIWNYVKGKVTNAPLWGNDMKKQGKINQKKRD